MPLFRKSGAGAIGPQGEQGEAGYTPIKGVDYFDGENGLLGADGPPGAKGDKGDTGSAGSNGADGAQGPQGAKGDTGDNGIDGVSNYTLSVQALTSSPADGATVYFGNMPKAPSTTLAVGGKVYIPKAGTIKAADIYCYSGTAGTGESWSLYIRKNNSEDTLIATLSVADKERRFYNAELNIPVNQGDYITIKSVQPAWSTNPLTTIYGGYIYIE